MQKLRKSNPALLIIDLFCGAGGVTTGFVKAKLFGKKVAKVIACVNHDPIAIASHWANHKEVKHFTEDIRTLDLTDLINLVNCWKNKYPLAKVILWASLECTNFSRAKGGLPRDADSRTLAEDLYRYIEQIMPDFIKIENVEEFMGWGPLDEKGKPISRHEGRDYLRWVEKVKSFGYNYDHRLLNSADYGAYTSRTRFFGVFARYGLPIIFPTPTHTKKPIENGLFGPDIQKWKPVKEVLDFSDEGVSIFKRKKALSENTLARIYAGLIKYVAGGKEYFISKYYSGDPTHLNASIDNPAPTIRTKDGQALIKASLLTKYFSGRPNGKVADVNSPCGTITTLGGPALVQAFLTQYHKRGPQHYSVERPATTLSTRDRIGFVKINWLDKTYSGSENHQSVDQPAGSILTNDKHQLVKAEKFIMDTQFKNVGQSVEEPMGTITANRKWHYLINPSWFGNPGSVDAPCPTIIARQDKAPLYLIGTEPGKMAIPVFKDDSEFTIKIKEFMVLYDIIDIKMRMLRVLELKLIQGFPKDYVLKGNQSDQKKFIGNSVSPIVVQRMAETLAEKLRNISSIKKAA